jgi:hypothetical protein
VKSIFCYRSYRESGQLANILSIRLDEILEAKCSFAVTSYTLHDAIVFEEVPSNDRPAVRTGVSDNAHD